MELLLKIAFSSVDDLNFKVNEISVSVTSHVRYRSARTCALHYTLVV